MLVTVHLAHTNNTFPQIIFHCISLWPGDKIGHFILYLLQSMFFCLVFCDILYNLENNTLADMLYIKQIIYYSCYIYLRFHKVGYEVVRNNTVYANYPSSTLNCNHKERHTLIVPLHNGTDPVDFDCSSNSI